MKLQHAVEIHNLLLEVYALALRAAKDGDMEVTQGALELAERIEWILQNSLDTPPSDPVDSADREES